jgi:hypothetical protein
MSTICVLCACAGLQPLNGCFRGWSGVRLAKVPLLAIVALLCLGLNLFAQAPYSTTTEDANKSWTAVTDLNRENVVPARIIESHNQSGNRTVDKRSVQLRGDAGHFEPYEDSETESVQVDANTARTTTRTFGQDGNRRRTLLDETEESKHTLPNGDWSLVRITSRSDLNGRLQEVQRETVEFKKMGSDSEVTNTTLLLPSINGGVAPAVKTQQIRRRSANDSVQSQATLLRDGAGNWQAREIRQNFTRQEADNLSTEDRIFRCNAEGKLVEVSRVVGRRSGSTLEEKRDVVETYSVHIPGASPNGSLQLVERATTTQGKSATGGQITTQKVEQSNLGNPNAGLRLSIDATVSVGRSGLQATRTIRTRDVNAGFGVIEVDTTESDKVLTIGMPAALEHPN